MSTPTTTCPDAGRWRAWLDEAVEPPAAPLADHLTSCAACAGLVGELRVAAAHAAAAIDTLAPTALPSAAATARALDRLDHRRRAAAPDRIAGAPAQLASRRRRMTLALTAPRWRIALGGIAAALLLTVLLGTPEGRTAAAQFLAQFRSQRFEVVTIDPSFTRTGLTVLAGLGTVQGDRRRAAPEEVRSLPEASQRVGFPLKQPAASALPAGLDTTPKILVSPASEFRLTLDRTKAQAYFQASGHPEASLPERYQGATLVVGTPPVAFLQYSRSNQDLGLIVGQAGELTVGVEGNVPLAELRDYLLGLPDLPADTVRQLRGMQDWRTTLPIPVASDRIAWQETTIAGGPGLLLADNTGVGSAAIWQRDGRIYGVAGAARATEIQRVADSLR